MAAMTLGCRVADDQLIITAHSINCEKALRVREEGMLGVLGSVFGVLGIFTFGLLFVPLGLLCIMFSFFKG